jgi:hypothetical protein
MNDHLGGAHCLAHKYAVQEDENDNRMCDKRDAH